MRKTYWINQIIKKNPKKLVLKFYINYTVRNQMKH